MKDPHNLARFVDAQDAHGTYATAIAELGDGHKLHHWMWFVFPQIEGLGSSATSRYFAIRSAEEAKAYACHSILGARLRECTKLVLASDRSNASDFFGEVNTLKLRSSMTLFQHVARDCELFAAVLDKYFGGVADPATEALLVDTERRAHSH